MKAEFILIPVLAQVLLTLCMFMLLGSRKTKAIRAGLVDRQKASLHRNAWPDDVVRVSNNIQNQFQTPVLFYVLCLSFLILDQVSVLVLSIASLFVVTRVVHVCIHVGANYVPTHFRVFLLGCLCLVALCLVLASQLIMV
jgi:hypothetical protein